VIEPTSAAVRVDVEKRDVRVVGATKSQLLANVLDVLLFGQGPSAGPTYSTPPFVVVVRSRDGDVVLREFPAERDGAAAHLADQLRAEMSGMGLRAFLEKYSTPTHLIDAVCPE
jgi:hypothetical protein